MERAMLAPKPTPAPQAEPAKTDDVPLHGTIMALAQAVADTASLVAESSRQQAAAIQQMAAIKERKPTGMEARVKRDENKLLTRVIVKFTYDGEDN